MTPAKCFAEMKDSGIHWMGRIPNNWKLIRAKFHFTQTNNRGNETPILLAASQKYGVCPQSWLEGVVQVSENTDLQQFKTVHKNDFVISLRSFQGGFERSDFEGVCSPAYQVFHADNSFDNNFLKYLFKNELFIDEMNSLTVGIREGRNIKYEDFANSLIFVPPLDEQTAIAAYLDTQCAKIDEIIAQAKASIEDYKQWKASIIYEAVTKGLDPNVEMKDSGIEWIGKIPKQWGTKQIRYLFELRDERNDLPLEQVNLISLYTDLGVVQHSDLEKITGNKAVTADGYKQVYPNDIVVNIILCWMGAIGMSNYAGVTSPAYDVYKPKDSQVTLSKYYHYLFRTARFNGKCYTVGRGIMAMRWRTYSSEFRAIKVPVPSYKTQVQIVEYLDSVCSKIDDLISEKQSLIDNLESYKKSLIYEVVTGKRRVI